MRKLTLDEKISMKGQLAQKGVFAAQLLVLNTQTALHYWWACFGVPLSYYATPKVWRTSLKAKPVFH